VIFKLGPVQTQLLRLVNSEPGAEVYAYGLFKRHFEREYGGTQPDNIRRALARLWARLGLFLMFLIGAWLSRLLWLYEGSWPLWDRAVFCGLMVGALACLAKCQHIQARHDGQCSRYFAEDPERVGRPDVPGAFHLVNGVVEVHRVQGLLNLVVHEEPHADQGKPGGGHCSGGPASRCKCDCEGGANEYG